MKVKDMEISKLKPYANNPRKNEAAIVPVAESIKAFGFKVPIVIDKAGVIVAGHTRLEAAKRLGLDKVPCVVADDLTPEQVKAFRLADNKVSEFAVWDAEKLAEELADISTFDMKEFGFNAGGKEFFERKNKDGDTRQEGNEEYNEFLDKFETKKTTDDCYTPDNIYEVVADYVAEKYGVKKQGFIRPFYPGGDYKSFIYPKGCVVVDNPPFSIFAEIVKYYNSNGVKFFLFGPALTLCSGSGGGQFCAVCVGADVLYENGATVKTSFATNLEKTRIKSEPELYKRIDEENKKNLAAQHKNLPKYNYPMHVVTAAMVQRYSHYGVEFSVGLSESSFIRELDEQKESGKAIYGGGFLLSERAAAERAAAERAAAERAAATCWKLSEREQEIVRSLSMKGGAKP